MCFFLWICLVPVNPVLFKHWSFFRYQMYHNYTLGFFLLHFSVVAKNVNSCIECTDAVVDVLVTLDIVVPLYDDYDDIFT